MTDTPTKPDYSGLSAVFINCTLTPSPKNSHTDTLLDVVRGIMSGAGVTVRSFRSIDEDIAAGVFPDMTEHEYDTDAGWIGEIGPGPSYGDAKDDGSRVGFDSEFSARNSTFLAWNLMHTAHLLKASGGIPAYGTSRQAWEDGARLDHPNPEYR